MNIARNITFIREIVFRFQGLTLLNVLVFVLVGVMEAAAVFSFASIIDFFIGAQAGTSGSVMGGKFRAIMTSLQLPYSLPSLFAVFFLLNFLRVLISCGSKYLVLKTRVRVIKDLILGILADAFAARWYFFTSGSQGMMLNTFMRETSVIGSAFSAVAQLFASLMLAIGILFVPFYISWQITMVSIILAVLIWLGMSQFGRLAYRWGQQSTSTANEFGRVLTESLSSMKLILGFGNIQNTKESISRAWDRHQDVRVKSETLEVSIHQFYQLFGFLILIAALLMARGYGIPFAESMTLLYALVRIIPIASEVSKTKITLDNFYASFEQICNLQKKARSLRQPTGSQMFDGLKDSIVLQNVSFAYPGNLPVLQNISVKINKGSMVAFVGGSGVGKSSLIDVIMGFNEPQEGRVLIDGIPLKEYDIVSFRGKLGYVPQDTFLFNDTIRANLLWAKPEATQQEVEEACRLAYADKFITDLPQAYDTPIGDRGVRLSGGQQQRLSLARAILRKPSLLILDEATSSLDTESELYIQLAIEQIAEKTTIVVIAHRLSTIIRAEHIYVLKEGRIIEQGNYARLLAQDGNFAKMIRLQHVETSI